MQWQAVYHHVPSGKATGNTENEPEARTFVGPMAKAVDDPTAKLVEDLIFTIPDVEFTVEVNILGLHRVTVHFKGADISIDAM